MKWTQYCSSLKTLTLQFFGWSGLIIAVPWRALTLQFFGWSGLIIVAPWGMLTLQFLRWNGLILAVPWKTLTVQLFGSSGLTIAVPWRTPTLQFFRWSGVVLAVPCRTLTVHLLGWGGLIITVPSSTRELSEQPPPQWCAATGPILHTMTQVKKNCLLPDRIVFKPKRTAEHLYITNATYQRYSNNAYVHRSKICTHGLSRSTLMLTIPPV